MKNALTIVTILGSLLFLAAPAAADWNVNDDYKMHWPQLPNPDGWDVNITRPHADSRTVVADDWLCMEPGTGAGYPLLVLGGA